MTLSRLGPTIAFVHPTAALVHPLGMLMVRLRLWSEQRNVRILANAGNWVGS